MLKKLLFASALTAVLFSCKKNDEEDNSSSYEVPSTYTFERSNSTTVDFSGQTSRLKMLDESEQLISIINKHS